MENSNRYLIATDPNLKANREVPAEDLCIFVNLEVEKPSRSSIFRSNTGTFVENTNKDVNKRHVSFFEGTNINGVQSLTTKFSDVGGNYRKVVTKLSVSDDYETLGITNIDIDFNSSYAPMVKIDFVDIRGASVLEPGDTSKYDFFFSLPYPIYKLTIKGYYGHPVTYCLHMTKFNAKFNASNGNFEIRCEFIGHTYAFLTDMLMGYLSAAVETPNGKRKLASLKTADPSLLSIRELLDGIDKLNKSLTQIRSNNPTIKKISSIDDKLNKIEGLKSIIHKLRSDLISRYDDNVFDIDSIYTYAVSIVGTGSDVSTLITDTEKIVADYIVNINENLENKLLLDETKFKNFEISKVTNSSQFTFYNNQLAGSNLQVTDTNKYNSITSKTGGKLSGNNIIIDVKAALDEIANKEVYFKELKTGYLSDVSIEVRNNVANETNIDMSIGNVLKILSTHVDIFMELIREVGVEAGKDTGRKTLKGKVIPDGSDDTIIYPFPTYSDTTKNNEEKWIGNLDPNIPEVKFIESLVDGFLIVAESNEARDANLVAGSTLFYPVSVLDTDVFKAVNPYVTLANTGKVEDVIRTIMDRLMVFAGSTNTSLTLNEVILMATAEANSVNDNIINQTIKAMIANRSGNELIDRYKKINTNFVSGTVVEDGTSYSVYSNKSAINVGGSSAGRYVNNGKNIDDTSVYLKVLDVPTYNSTSGGYYPDMSGEKAYEKVNTDTKVDLNTVINDTLLYKDSKRNKPKYSPLNSAYKVQEFFSVIAHENNPVDSDLLFWRVLPQSNIDSFEGFYDVATVGNVVSNVIKNNRTSTDKINWVNINAKVYSYGDGIITQPSPTVNLFNSDFYFRQKDNRGRALLFLHTLPFDGLASSNDHGVFSVSNDKKLLDNYGYLSVGGYKRALFNHRGGFVKVPKTWLLFVGGLLWRNEQSSDPLTYNNMLSDSLPTKTQYLKVKQTGDNYNPLTFVGGGYGYVDIEDTILKLPKQAKTELINYFLNWVDADVDELGSWNYIRSKYELFDNDKVNTTQRDAIFTQISTATSSDDIKQVLISNGCDENIVNRYETIGYNLVKTSPDDAGTHNLTATYIDTVQDKTGDLSKVISALIEPVIVANTTWRIWVDKSTVDSKSSVYTEDFTVSSTIVEQYVNTFLNVLKPKCSPDVVVDNKKDLSQKAFGAIDSDTIKLNLYRTVKAIYDKWIAGSTSTGLYNCITCGYETKGLYSSFRVIDKAYRDISKSCYINPNDLKNELSRNTNQSFYDYVTRVLASNNFDFIALPTYIDYSSQSEIDKLFEVLPYSKLPDQRYGASFVCMYVGQGSKHLDINKGEYKSDGIVFNTTSPDGAFVGEGSNIPIFEVDYGSSNQSVFKNLNLDQSEFSETDESLRIIESIAMKGDKISRTPIGQNLFNVYSTRSYSVSMDSMGNAMIQPMMYFQLSHVPMFRGGYLITRVSHNIKPNTMSTTFRGVRVSKIMTPMIEETDVYMNMLGSFSDVDYEKQAITDRDDTADWVIEARNIEPSVIKALDFGKPCDSDIIKSNVGYRVLKGETVKKKHHGLDFELVVRSPLYSMFGGVIEYVRIERGYGLHVVTKYVDNKGNVWRALYAHLTAINTNYLDISKLSDAEQVQLVSQTGIVLNADITKGSVIAYSGGDPKNVKSIKGLALCGAWTTGPHLHIELKYEEASKVSPNRTAQASFYGSTTKDLGVVLGYKNFASNAGVALSV